MGEQLHKHLLRRVARFGWVSVKEIQRDGIHLVLIRFVDRAKRVAISPAATLDDLPDLRIAQMITIQLDGPSPEFLQVYAPAYDLSCHSRRHVLRKFFR